MSLAYCFWMQPIEGILSRICIHWKRQIHVANNGSGHTRTAVSARSISTSIADPMAQWIGNCCARALCLSTRFLDDVVEANAYVPAVPQLTEAAHNARRIGLGIMGLADLMYHVGVRYGSKEGQEFGAQVMEFVRYHAMQTSIELAEERGAIPCHQRLDLRYGEHDVDSAADR